MAELIRRSRAIFVAAFALLFVGLSAWTPAARAQDLAPVRWEFSANLTDESRRAIQLNGNEALRPYREQGVDAAVTDSELALAGEGELDQLRAALFDGGLDGADFLGGAVQTTVHVAARTGTPLELRLQMRPGTGYQWEVVADPTLPFSVDGEAQFAPLYAGDGAPAVQTIHLQADRDSEAVIQLLYRRPFGEAEAPHAKLEVWVQDDMEALVITDPTPAQPGFSSIDLEQTTSPVEQSGLDGVLPTSWDWRTQGVLPAIRDQGNCGSCWAFATVGAMEAAILRTNGVTTDLSEQFLVSCNYDGWNCEVGGGTAHLYHYTTLARSQTAAGAVLETAKPYTATTGTCTSAYSHPYALNNWSWVASGGLATVDQLKDAIYNHGPIKASVCADSGWNNYHSGVYTPPTGTSTAVCGGGTNHAIVLVGWDDSTSSWTLRNSWGSSWWGESGYMHIAWDPTGSSSKIGYGASWVSVPGSAPGAFSKSSPGNGATNVSTLEDLAWTSSANASRYEYCIDKSNDNQCSDWKDAGASTSASPQLDPASTYYWHARAVNAVSTTYSQGSTTAYWSFTTSSAPPPFSVLLVDDDDNDPNVRAYYTDALTALGISHEVWDTLNSDNEPSAATLAAYDAVVWFTGAEYGGAAGPGATGEASLATYLDGGGCTLISSQDYLWDRGGLTSFMQSYLGVTSATSDTFQTTATGAGSVFGGVGARALSYPFSNFSDTLNPGASPAELAFSGNIGNAGVDKNTAVYHTAYLGFPIEALPSAADRQQVISAFLNTCQGIHRFADVPVAGKEWMEPWVLAFYDAGITTGCATNPLRYCPENAVTRASMAVFVLRAIEGPAYVPPTSTHVFADLPVAGKEWMEPWVNEFYARGFTTGCGVSPLRYCPDNQVTRASMAVFLLRALEGSSYAPPPATHTFADQPVAGKEWMEPWVDEFYTRGITTGCGASPLRYCPENPVTRAAMAVFIGRAYALYP